MPTVEENKKKWDGNYDWSARGNVWSALWGTPSMEWYGTILPRIKSYVPADRILEIACGCGRWTQYLKDLCINLTVVDLSSECIQTCRQRFSDCSNIDYYVNDGKSLEMIPDSSVDFVFSFDSLVHVDESVMRAYISQLQRILNDNGTAFIHHSNLGEYHDMYSKIRRIPRLERLLKRLHLLDKSLLWRDFSVDALKVEALAKEYGMNCISQEMIPWDTKSILIDCFTTMKKNNSSGARTNRVLRNKNFMREAANLSQLSKLYN